MVYRSHKNVYFEAELAARPIEQPAAERIGLEALRRKLTRKSIRAIRAGRHHVIPAKAGNP